MMFSTVSWQMLFIVLYFTQNNLFNHTLIQTWGLSAVFQTTDERSLKLVIQVNTRSLFGYSYQSDFSRFDMGFLCL